MPVTTARQRVLAYLKKQQAASAAEIGRALGMTAANVRHHLAGLLTDGLVSAIGERRGERKGRPVKLFGFSPALGEDNLAALSDALLDEWAGSLRPAKRDEALRSLAKRLAEGRDTAEAPLSVQRRLARAVERLNELHYQARWEAGAEGPRIILGHCPYAAIIEKHPELCQMDAYLLSGQMGAAARQTAKLERGASGLRFCAFVVK